MSIRSRILGAAAAGTALAALGIPGVAVGAAPDGPGEEGVEQPCVVDCGPVEPGPDDGGGFDPQGPGSFQQCTENEVTPGDDCYDHPQDPGGGGSNSGGGSPGSGGEDAPRRADPNFTG
ncbi:MAG TPA: hypothetical protein VF152_07310 [Acidimicrobiia bacterium]